MKRGYTIKL